jgi:pSer/pThr/pTyr-binding forkhead associated (FHA) protein
MPARLFCKTGQLAGSSFEIGDQAQIGKNSENTIQLNPAVISGRHARIFYDPQKQSYYIEDLNSRNGTRVDGTRLRGKERLDRLNVITFANTFDFIFQVVAQGSRVSAKSQKSESKTSIHEEGFAAPPLQPAGSKTMLDDGTPPTPPVPGSKGGSDRGQKTTLGDEPMEIPSFGTGGAPAAKDPRKTSIDDGGFAPPPIQPKAAPRRMTFVLELKNPTGGVNVFVLKEGENVVGRISTCDIPIDDASVSRKHAALHLAGETLTVKDLGSKNSTFVDGRKISAEVTLVAKSKVRFGLVEGFIVTREAS